MLRKGTVIFMKKLFLPLFFLGLLLCLFCACNAEKNDASDHKGTDSLPQSDPVPSLPSDELPPPEKDISSVIPTKGLKYRSLADGTFEVTGVENGRNVTELVIPPTYRGKPVVSIADGAFNNLEALVSVTISEGITKIGAEAFCECYSLASVIIPEGVTGIGGYAFYNCALTSVTIPGSVECIRDGAFNSCYYLASVTLENGVKEIQNEAFCGCHSLTSLTIPASVTKIGGNPFGNDSLDGNPFAFCSNLQTITVEEGNARYHSRGNCIIDKETKTLVAGCNYSVISPEDILSIGKMAFSGCRELFSLTLPRHLTAIEEGAFEYCDDLTIRYEGSENEWNLISKSEKWNYSAENFKMCFAVPNFTLGLSYILSHDQTSYYVAGMGSATESDIVIPENYNGKPVAAVASNAFSGNSAIVSVKLPKSVEQIQEGAFANCSSLASVTLEEGLTVIEKNAFLHCVSLRAVTLPKSVTEIEGNPFAGCKSLLSLTVEDGSSRYVSERNCLIEKESRTLIAGCKSSVVSVYVEIAAIGDAAFEGCDSITYINLPQEIRSIGARAFADCKNLKNIYFGGTKAEWENLQKGKAWDHGITACTVICTDGNIEILY